MNCRQSQGCLEAPLGEAACSLTLVFLKIQEIEIKHVWPHGGFCLRVCDQSEAVIWDLAYLSRCCQSPGQHLSPASSWPSLCFPGQNSLSPQTQASTGSSSGILLLGCASPWGQSSRITGLGLYSGSIAGSHTSGFSSGIRGKEEMCSFLEMAEESGVSLGPL